MEKSNRVASFEQQVSFTADHMVKVAESVDPYSEPRLSPPHPLWRPVLGKAVWSYLVEQRTRYDMDTFTWDVIFKQFQQYFYPHGSWLFQARRDHPAGTFSLPRGTSLNRLRHTILEAFQAGAGDEETLCLVNFSSDLDFAEVLHAKNLSTSRKKELFSGNNRTPPAILEEFLLTNPRETKQFLNHPAYPLHGLPNEAGKSFPSMNAATLQEGWETQELTQEHLEGISPYYMKSLCYGLGQFGAEENIQRFLRTLDSYEHSHVLLEGIFRRGVPLQDLGTLTAVVGHTLQLSSGTAVPIQQWWQTLIASRAPFSFQEVELLLTLAGTKHLSAEDVAVLTAWLDDDGELKVDELDDLPAHLRWDIKTA